MSTITPKIGLAFALLLAACSSSSTTASIPQAPQLIPNELSLWHIYPVVPVGTTSLRPVVAVNGGRNDLVVDSVAVEGYAGPDDASVFQLDFTTPSTVVSQDVLEIPLTFAPVTSGVHRARLVVHSNAANTPSVTFELVGPAPASPAPAEPELVYFEGDGTVSTGAVGTFAPVRFFNLGVGELVITSYTIGGTDASSFALQANTTTPSTECSAAACGAALPSGCHPVRLSYGQWLGLALDYTPPAAGVHTGVFSVTSNASDCPAELTLTGN